MRLLLAAAAALLLMAPQPAQPVNARIGLIEPHDAPHHADQLRVGWGRARFLWSSIQPDGPHQWIDAELTDAELARELDAGREVVGLLIGVPVWARGEQGMPRGLDLPHDDPRNLWAAYVREAVRRYRGRIDRWIIWNEPDVWDANHPGFTWPGTEADFVQLMRVSYLVAKEENPDALLHLAAMSHWWDALYGRELYFERLLTTLAAQPDAVANNYFYDVATLHLYFNPVDVYELVSRYRGIQAGFGLDKPLWVIETNAAPSEDPAWPVPQPTFSISLVEQAAYMPQALSLGLAAGAERIAVYKLIDTPGDVTANPEPFGLVRANGEPRPAFRTVQVAVEQLADTEDAFWSEVPGVGQVLVHRPGQTSRILWSRVPQAQRITIEAGGPTAALVDMWGTETPISAEEGHYTLTLAGAACGVTTGDYCMIGGPPVYLVESGQLDVDAFSADDTITVEAVGQAAFDDLAQPTRIPFPIIVPALLTVLVAAAGFTLARSQP